MATTPSYCPSVRELDDLELLLIGAVPGRAFNTPGSPLTLHLPAGIAEAATAAGDVTLTDPEGVPLARLAWPSGIVTPLARPSYGPFRRLYLTPAQVREQYPGRPGIAVTGPLSTSQLDALAGRRAILLALVGHGTPDLSPVALLRATVLAAGHLGDADVVAVPLAHHAFPGADPALQDALCTTVLSSYAEVAHTPPEVAHPPVTYPPDIAAVIAADRPSPKHQGLVVFFTGLSGSGKSTLARALTDHLLENGNRPVTSLDGDVVRRRLSAGLTFSREDRETNIRRIGWVAAEIARHHGIAVASPIAPYDATRREVRRDVDEAGGAFFLVHVATPLAECERRDRRGLYARARAGEIPDFTGIDAPYEIPRDAEVVVGTTGRSVEDALGEILGALRARGYVEPAHSPAEAAPSLHTGGELDATSAKTVNVLFVCTANICRSAYMALATATRNLPGVEVDSAGTRGLLNQPMDADMAATLPPGADPGTFHSKPVTRELLAWADIVLTAQSTHRTFLLDDHPQMFRKVFTLGQAAEAIRRHREIQQRHGHEFITALGQSRGAADPALDIADPYHRGAEDARACATQIDGFLDTVLPALAAY